MLGLNGGVRHPATSQSGSIRRVLVFRSVLFIAIVVLLQEIERLRRHTHCAPKKGDSLRKLQSLLNGVEHHAPLQEHPRDRLRFLRPEFPAMMDRAAHGVLV